VSEEYERKSRLLDEYCAVIARDRAVIERSVVVDGPPGKLNFGWPSPGFSHGYGYGSWLALLTGKVLLTWDDKGCLGPCPAGFEEFSLSRTSACFVRPFAVEATDTVFIFILKY
jgi:hypothetical protein